MKWNEAIFSAMTDVRDDLLEKSNAPNYPRARRLRWLPTAACCALVLGTALALLRLTPLQPTQTPAAEDAAQMDTLPPDGQVETPPDSQTETALDSQPEAAAAGGETYLKPQAAYVLHENGEPVGPCTAVDHDGNEILSIDWGNITLLEDEATGEIVALAVETWEAGQPSSGGDGVIALYSLQGELLWEVEGSAVRCRGELLLVRRDDLWNLYRGESHAHAAGNLYRIGFAGTDLGYLQTVEDGPVMLLNEDGTAVAELEAMSRITTYTWENRGYLCAQEAGLWGLVDGAQQWVVEPAYQEIYGLSNGYALCRTEDGCCAVSLDSGEVVLESPHEITAVFSQGVLLELEESLLPRGVTGWGRSQFVSWDGEVYADAAAITVLDDEGDGQADLLLLWSEGATETTDLCRPDGTLIRQVDCDASALAPVSAGTLLWNRDETAADGSRLQTMVLLDVETGTITERFDQAYLYGGRYWESANSLLLSHTFHLICASYRDESGAIHTDILDESGKCLVSDLYNSSSTTPQGDVFTALVDGRPALVRLDGTILYQSAP